MYWVRQKVIVFIFSVLCASLIGIPIRYICVGKLCVCACAFSLLKLRSMANTEQFHTTPTGLDWTGLESVSLLRRGNALFYYLSHGANHQTL